MALQTSGAISLDQIHVEAGGTSTTTATINDTDIRELITEPTGVLGSNSLSFNQWYGAEANIAGQVLIPIGTSGTTQYTLPMGVQTICVFIITPGRSGYTASNQLTAGWGGAGGNMGYWNHIDVSGAGSTVAPVVEFQWSYYVNWQSPYYDYGSKLRMKWWPGASNTPYASWNQGDGAQYQDQAYTGKGIKMEHGDQTNPGRTLTKYGTSFIFNSTISNEDSNQTVRGGRGGKGNQGGSGGGGASGYSNSSGNADSRANQGPNPPSLCRSGGDGGASNSTGGTAGYDALVNSGGAGGAGGTYAYNWGQGVGKGAGGGGVGILGVGSTGSGGAVGSSNNSYSIVRGGGGGSGGQDGGTVTRSAQTFSGTGGYYGSGGGGGGSVQFGSGGLYGGGGGGGGAMWNYGPSSYGAAGAPGTVRLMWGNNRAYPSTNVADQ
jgi:hypothetical protein